MSSPPSQAPLTGGYDQSLLAAAPVATKAAKQEGYNVDLLDEGRHRSTQRPPRTADVEASRGMKENYLSPVGREPRRKLPFWRTRAGIIVLAVGAVIIIGAVVGGAVGGSVGKKSHNNKVASGLKGGTTATSGSEAQATNSGSTSKAGPGQQTEPTSAPPAAGKPLSGLPTVPPSGGPISLPTGLPTPSVIPPSNGGGRR